ncbi:MAG: hypothetical protein WBL65_17200 [Bryobacteraceae bacterium]
MPSDPRLVYCRLLEERRADIALRERRHRALGYGRLAAVIAAAAVVWLALAGHLSIVWITLPIAVFAVLVAIHDRLLRILERRRRAQRFFERALARLDGKWAGTGEPGDRYLDPAHPYARDLDLFGAGSLFELLCTARTHIGEDTLARWLLAPADPATARARQEAVSELRPRVDLREDLAVLAEESRTGVDPVSLAAWGEAPGLLERGRLHAAVWALTALGVAGVSALAAYVLSLLGAVRISEAACIVLRDVFLVVLAVNGTFLYRVHQRIGAVVRAAEDAAEELKLLSEVLVRLERESFHSPLLAALGASLDTEGAPPSKRIGRLNRLMELLDSRDHVLVRVAEPFVLWTTHLAFAVEAWRRHSGPVVRRWLTATGEMEALCSLASYAFEHPDDPFPEFVGDEALLEAEAIGHPLIERSREVRNDVRMGGAGPRVLVVSGSNMSGKSTLLRTLGVNAVLAQAGAPVRARRLRMSPLAVGASIRVTDSLQGGVSGFYAEILRLRQILDATARPGPKGAPVLFLIDEFLHGTNSHDRLIGAEAVVRGLVERGAIGLITTHDLALADIAGELGERAANVHFEDHIEDGRMVFDYVMRPGVVRKSNAIELMRSVGLEI